MYFDIKQ